MGWGCSVAHNRRGTPDRRILMMEIGALSRQGRQTRGRRVMPFDAVDLKECCQAGNCIAAIISVH